MKEKQLIPVKELPRYLPVSMATIRSWVFQQRLPVIRLGRLVMVKRSVLQRIQEEGLESVAEEARKSPDQWK